MTTFQRLLAVSGIALSITLGCAAPAQALFATDDDKLVEGNNGFAAAMYVQLAKTPGNMFFSPQSISSVLAMAYAGAGGDTADELKQALHVDLDADKFHPAMGALLKSLNTNDADAGYKLNVAGALWVEESTPLQTDFKKTMADHYDAALNTADFKREPEESRKRVNDWALAHTAQKITDLLPYGSVSAATRLVLASAIYFDGDWKTAFAPTATVSRPFRIPAAVQEPNVLMMSHSYTECAAKYWEDDELQALWLPYKGDRLSMMIFLPKSVTGLADVEKSLTPEKLSGWLAHDTKCPEVALTLPKFTMTYDVNAVSALRELGLNHALTAGEADFSGMNDDGAIFISGVFHKAFVKVDEEGTEAAAATGMTLSAQSVAMPPREPPVIFMADHPFLFLIRDDKTGAVLFMGRLANPS